MFFVRILDIRYTGGDIRDATNCCGQNKVSEHSQSKANTDVIENEDADVAEERRRVQSLLSHPSAQVILEVQFLA